jgi:hypothetical protein
MNAFSCESLGIAPGRRLESVSDYVWSPVTRGVLFAAMAASYWLL